MAQPFNMGQTLVDGHGNFGSLDGDGAAAMRYTEAKLTPIALELLKDIDKDTVNWNFNFDDSCKEPETLPGRFPNLYVNGCSGIAVGLTTNIPPHNLREVVKACIAYKKNGETLSHMPYDIEGVEPVYTEIKGWQTDLTKLRSEEELPVEFKEYIKFLEKELGVPVKYLSIGPDRDQTITRSI